MTTKTRITVTVDTNSLEEARQYDLNLSAIASEAVKQAATAARKEAWQKRYGAAVLELDDWIMEHGHPLADYAVGPLARSVPRGDDADAV